MKTARNIIRWLSRAFSLFVIWFVAMELIFPHSTRPATNDEILMLCIFGVAILGYIVAWFKELLGGIISTTAFVVFHSISFELDEIPFLVLFLFSILFIVSGVMSKRIEKNTK